MLQRFITDNQNADVALLALQRDRYPMLSDSDFRFALQQIDGRQRTRDKLPTFAAIDGWCYPPRLNLEQCSSERTARFKAELLAARISQLSIVNSQLLIDATGGYGVDTFFMSEQAAETHYFEQNADLAAIAEHNFRLAGKSVCCHAESFDVAALKNFIEPMSKMGAANVEPMSGVLYLDPARRDSHGGKVFRLEDCTPNVIEIVRFVQRNYPDLHVLLKLSPMLDFHQAVRQLGGTWGVYVVSVNAEVKELLLLSAPAPVVGNPITPIHSREGQGVGLSSSISYIHAVALDAHGEHIFTFTPDEESAAEPRYLPNTQSSTAQPPNTQLSTAQLTNTQLYLFEPDAAILKTGAFRLLSTRYNLLKAAPNTHLYFSGKPNVDLPGRLWLIVAVYASVRDVQRAFAGQGITHANVLTRNYVLPANTLRRQLRLKDGGNDYIIACRIADKPVLLHCKRKNC